VKRCASEEYLILGVSDPSNTEGDDDGTCQARFEWRRAEQSSRHACWDAKAGGAPLCEGKTGASFLTVVVSIVARLNVSRAYRYGFSSAHGTKCGECLQADMSHILCMHARRQGTRTSNIDRHVAISWRRKRGLRLK
jgi:hypothetical protein